MNMSAMEWMLVLTFVVCSTTVHLTILRYLRNDNHRAVEARAWDEHRKGK